MLGCGVRLQQARCAKHESVDMKPLDNLIPVHAQVSSSLGQKLQVSAIQIMQWCHGLCSYAATTWIDSISERRSNI